MAGQMTEEEQDRRVAEEWKQARDLALRSIGDVAGLAAQRTKRLPMDIFAWMQDVSADHERNQLARQNDPLNRVPRRHLGTSPITIVGKDGRPDWSRLGEFFKNQVDMMDDSAARLTGRRHENTIGPLAHRRRYRTERADVNPNTGKTLPLRPEMGYETPDGSTANLANSLRPETLDPAVQMARVPLPEQDVSALALANSSPDASLIKSEDTGLNRFSSGPARGNYVDKLAGSVTVPALSQDEQLLYLSPLQQQWLSPEERRIPNAVERQRLAERRRLEAMLGEMAGY